MVNSCTAALFMFTLHIIYVDCGSFPFPFHPFFSFDFVGISDTWVAIAKFTAAHCLALSILWTSQSYCHVMMLVISEYDQLFMLCLSTRLNGFRLYEISCPSSRSVAFTEFVFELPLRGRHESEALSLCWRAWGFVFLKVYFDFL